MHLTVVHDFCGLFHGQSRWRSAREVGSTTESSNMRYGLR